MLINKITVGFVVQLWDDKNKQFIAQVFVAGDQVDYEDPLTGENVVAPKDMDYLQFGMVQPELDVGNIKK